MYNIEYIQINKTIFVIQKEQCRRLLTNKKSIDYIKRINNGNKQCPPTRSNESTNQSISQSIDGWQLNCITLTGTNEERTKDGSEERLQVIVQHVAD